MPSQWALQYFDPSAETQLQAGFAHFLSFAIDLPPLPQANLWPAWRDTALGAASRRIAAHDLCNF
jgi:hypothetical protein